MKVAVLGGTGRMGGDIARVLARTHQIIVGSRDPAKGREAARKIPGAISSDYLGAAMECNLAVIAVPFSAINEVAPLAKALSGKLVISIINPLKREGGVLSYPLEKGSAAEMLAAMLPDSLVATAFNNLPDGMLATDDHPPVDVLVAASSKQAFNEASALVKSIPGLRPLYAGPLAAARLVEQLTVLELKLAKWNGTSGLAPKFVSREG